jgi:hypothetical protein
VRSVISTLTCQAADQHSRISLTKFLLFILLIVQDDIVPPEIACPAPAAVAGVR